ncbi:MAG: hypothetical protein IJF83_11200 [Methanobrevibacter sp.]|nr:hypothetical protein [Methanobrevibacter sp.]
MTNICKLKFEVSVHVHDECADGLGEDLAKFLEESWFNGEDVLEVIYTGHDVVL